MVIVRCSILVEVEIIVLRIKKGTGGGPSGMVPVLTDAECTIIDELGDTAAFSGIPGGGIESAIGGPSSAVHLIAADALAKSLEVVKAVATMDTTLAASLVEGEPEQPEQLEQLDDGPPPPKTPKLSSKRATPAAASSTADQVRQLQIQVLEAQLANQKKIGETCDALMSVARKYGDIADRITQCGMIEHLSGFNVVFNEVTQNAANEEAPIGDFSHESDLDV